MKTSDAIAWLRPFHEAAEGRTGEALDTALGAIGEAPDGMATFAIREGLRVLLHAFRRTAGIRVDGDAETMPLFVATTDGEGIVVHQMRSLVSVAEIATQIKHWGTRREQAARELVWWVHQRDLARRADAEPTERLVDVWQRLGVPYELFSDEEAVAQ